MYLQECFRVNKPTVIYEKFDKEVIVIEFNSGNYYSLDKAGSDIWSLIESGVNVGEIIGAISHIYKGSSSVIENAISQFLDKLKQENLIVPDNSKEPGNNKEVNLIINPDTETEKPDFEVPVIDKFTDMQNLLLLDPIHEVDETGWPNIKRASSLEKK